MVTKKSPDGINLRGKAVYTQILNRYSYYCPLSISESFMCRDLCERQARSSLALRKVSKRASWILNTASLPESKNDRNNRIVLTLWRWPNHCHRLSVFIFSGFLWWNLWSCWCRSSHFVTPLDSRAIQNLVKDQVEHPKILNNVVRRKKNTL